MKSSQIGRLAEDKAVDLLKKKGYRIIERNFRTKSGEIDIIAEDGNTVVFVEVRFRKNKAFGTPEETIDQKKIKKIILTANRYISMKNLTGKDIRFDVIAVDTEGIRHIIGAFDLDFI